MIFSVRTGIKSTSLHNPRSPSHASGVPDLEALTGPQFGLHNGLLARGPPTLLASFRLPFRAGPARLEMSARGRRICGPVNRFRALWAFSCLLRRPSRRRRPPLLERPRSLPASGWRGPEVERQRSSSIAIPAPEPFSPIPIRRSRPLGRPRELRTNTAESAAPVPRALTVPRFGHPPFTAPSRVLLVLCLTYS